VIRDCKATPPAPGFVGPHGEKQVLVPGDPERTLEEKYRREGIYVEDTTWNLILSAAKDVGVDISNI
jgi:LDH2 family malate/lactate/ureidoglycolate dehydrogenase